MATPRTTSKTSVTAPAPRTAARTASAKGSARPSSDEIAKRAFEIWEASGRPPGRDVENWLQAEAELRGG
jgi:hypothetical protein